MSTTYQYADTNPEIAQLGQQIEQAQARFSKALLNCQQRSAKIAQQEVAELTSKLASLQRAEQERENAATEARIAARRRRA